jgi:hypothetical protein
MQHDSGWEYLDIFFLVVEDTVRHAHQPRFLDNTRDKKSVKGVKNSIYQYNLPNQPGTPYEWLSGRNDSQQVPSACESNSLLETGTADIGHFVDAAFG